MTKQTIIIVAVLLVGLGIMRGIWETYTGHAPVAVVTAPPKWCTAWCSGRGGVQESTVDRSRSGTQWGVVCGCHSGAEAELP